MLTKSIYIKNLCCPRCVTTLKNLIESCNIKVINIQNSIVIIAGYIEDIEELYNKLHFNGYEIIKAREQEVVDKVKTELLLFIANKEYSKIKMTYYLEQKLNLSYSYISKVFAKSENSSIEKYYIKLKIQKVQELLLSNNHNLSEIAYIYNYSSVQALSQQFKTIHGITVKEFKASNGSYANSYN